MSYHRKRRDRKNRKKISRIKTLLMVGFVLLSTAFLASGVFAASYLSQIAKLKQANITNAPQRSIVYAADGSEIGAFYVQNRERVSIGTVPPYVYNGIVAVEDRRFYAHHGVDYEAIGRALLANITRHQVSEGGSTITQQYIKNALIGDEVSIRRKVKEAYLATELERKYSKKQILEAYINTVYFGHGAYGIEAAAETYFGKRVENLTIGEGALLAGLPKSPQGFSPYDNPEEAKRRQSIVLKKMLDEKYLTKQQADEAATQPLQYKPLQTEDPNSKIAPYFVEYVKQQLLAKFGKETVFSGGLKIYTTLDPVMQKSADQTVKNALSQQGDPTGSIVSIEPKTGYIKVMSVGRDFKTFKYNIAAQGQRQPGSSFKTFVLISALEQHISPQSKFNGSSPIQIRLPNSTEIWTVHNAEGSVPGQVTLWDATIESINAVYAQLMMKVGPPSVVDVAKRMGITSPVEPYPAIAIGGLQTGVSPLEMASAYGTLAANGEHTKPIAITKVTDAYNNVLLENKPKLRKVVDPNIAGQTTKILRDVVAKGTGKAADIGRPQAGKTGTAENYQDAWFVGYTPDLATAVWMGHPEAQVKMENVHGSPGYGGVIPATMWSQFMREALKNTPAHDFPAFKSPKANEQNQKKQSTTTTTEPRSSTSTTSPSTSAPETTEPRTTEPSTTEPPTTRETPTTEAPTTETPTTEPPTTETPTTEPPRTAPEPPTTEPPTTEPPTTEPPTTSPPTTEPPPTTQPPTTSPPTTEPPSTSPGR